SSLCASLARNASRGSIHSGQRAEDASQTEQQITGAPRLSGSRGRVPRWLSRNRSVGRYRYGSGRQDRQEGLSSLRVAGRWGIGRGRDMGGGHGGSEIQTGESYGYH